MRFGAAAAMKERSRNILVGLTTLVGLIGLAALMLTFGSFTMPWDRGYPVVVELPDAGGLSEGSRVTLSGIPVGSIQNVSHGQTAAEVSIVARIDQDYDIPQGVIAEVRQVVVGSGSTLALTLPEALEPGPPLARDGTAVIQGEIVSPGDMVVKALDNILRGPSEDFHAFVESVAPLAGSVNDILADDQVQSDLRNTLGNVRKISETLETTAAKLDQAADSIPGLLDSTEKSIQDLAGDYRGVAQTLTGTLARVDAVAKQIEQGEGSAGRLLNDPELYENLNDAAQELEAALEDARTLIRQLRAEGVRVDL
ncbi:MAG: MlaD family protein [Planctomycetota bacterium]